MDGIINSVEMSLSKLREILKDRGASHAAVHGVAESGITERLNDMSRARVNDFVQISKKVVTLVLQVTKN